MAPNCDKNRVEQHDVGRALDLGVGLIRLEPWFLSYSHLVHLTREGSCPRLRNLSVQDARKKLGKFHKGEGIGGI